MKKILEVENKPSSEPEVTGRIVMEFTEKGARWKQEGRFRHAEAVMLLELVKNAVLGQHVAKVMEEQARRAQQGICLPDGSFVPPDR